MERREKAAAASRVTQPRATGADGGGLVPLTTNLVWYYSSDYREEITTSRLQQALSSTSETPQTHNPTVSPTGTDD